MGVTEVTFDEWDRCVTSGGGSHRPDDEGWGRGQRPVINVSWHDAQEYVSWLNGQVGGRPYRLPSESEWEYAARAGTVTRYTWGDSISGRGLAHCYGCGSRWDNESTAPVGSFGANGFGLHDMHGNVWELVGDCWNDSYEGAPRDGSVWRTGDCEIAPVRGGSWDFGVVEWNGRETSGPYSALRYLTGHVHRDWETGFRVARTLSGQ